MIRHLTALITALVTLMVANAGNRVTLTDAAGTPGSEAVVKVNLENDPGAVAMQLNIPIPEGTEYVDGSCTITSDRLAGHTVSAAVNGGKLVVLVYSTGLAEIPSGNDDVLQFTLRLGNEPGNYTLSPTVRLGDASGNAIGTEAVSGTATILASKIECGAETIDFGRSAIRGSYTRSLTIRNTGNQPLNITGIATSDGTLSVSPTDMTVEAGRSASAIVTYAPTVRAAAFNGSLRILSDAVNGDATVGITAIPYSVNELHIDAAQCSSGEEATITARMNNMEPITAADFSMTLPSGFEYVDGSAACTDRAPTHTISGSVTDGKLRIVMFHPANQPVDGYDGELLTFRLRSVTNRGSYGLTPENVRLANRDGEDMTSASSGSYITISAPSISCNSTCDMGDQSITSDVATVFSVRNYGNAPLTIERVVFLSDGFSIEEELPLTLNSYETKQITLRHYPASAGDFATQMNIYSNDPENPMKAIGVTGSVYEPNGITVSGEPNDEHDCYTLHVDLNNYTGIAAVQLDIEWLDGMTTDRDDMQLSERINGHSHEVAQLEDGIHRILLFSMSNTTIIGKEGNLFDLTFHGTDFIGSRMKISNIKLSGKDGKNYLSPGASPIYLDINPVLAESITLDRYVETAVEGNSFQLTATVLPTNTTDKTVVWRSTDESVATVDSEGNVTVIGKGSCMITAETTDGSGLLAECTLSALAGIEDIVAEEVTEVNIYNLNGILLFRNLPKEKIAGLPAGIYLIGNKKIMIR